MATKRERQWRRMYAILHMLVPGTGDYEVMVRRLRRMESLGILETRDLLGLLYFRVPAGMSMQAARAAASLLRMEEDW